MTVAVNEGMWSSLRWQLMVVAVNERVYVCVICVCVCMRGRESKREGGGRERGEDN